MNITAMAIIVQSRITSVLCHLGRLLTIVSIVFLVIYSVLDRLVVPDMYNPQYQSILAEKEAVPKRGLTRVLNRDSDHLLILTGGTIVSSGSLFECNLQDT